MNAAKYDRFGLNRFVEAQEGIYEIALAELRAGCKKTHWMWFVFPQVSGLGSSPMAQHYAIRSREEAGAYHKHPILGARLRCCAEALLLINGKSVEQIMGHPDDLKLNSSMTLFETIADPGSAFEAVLEKYFSGERDQKTLQYLAEDPE